MPQSDAISPLQPPREVARNAARSLWRVGQLLHPAAQIPRYRRPLHSRLDRPRLVRGLLRVPAEVDARGPVREHPGQATDLRARLGQEPQVHRCFLVIPVY